jgi:uncharacterized membrane protein
VVRLLVFGALCLPGGAFYGLNYVGVSNDAFLLIFAQILPIFLVMFIPFLFTD